MADVIDFSNRQSMQDESQEDVVCSELLKALLKEIHNYKDFVIFYKDTNNEIGMFDTEVDLVDKSVMVQLLQHSIQEEFDTGHEVDFEGDL